MKWNLKDGYTFTASVFQIDQQEYEKDGNGDKQFLDNEISGFEAQFTGHLTSSWTISAGYSFLDGETGQTHVQKSFQRICSLYGIITKHPKNLVLGLGLSTKMRVRLLIQQRAVLPDYFRVDAAAYYAINEDLRLQLNIENVLDETYYPSAHSTHQATVGAPINARISISGRF